MPSSHICNCYRKPRWLRWVSVAIALTFLLSVGTLVSPTQFSRCATPDTARAVGNYPSNGCPWWVPATLRSPLKESQVGLPLRGGDSIMHLFCTHTLLLTYTAASVGACIHRRGCDFTLTGRQVWVTLEDYRNAQCRSEIIHIESFFVHPQLSLSLRSM